MAGAHLTQAQCNRAKHLHEVVGHPLVTIAVIMKVGKKSLGKARARGWTPSKRPAPPMPADFRDRASEMCTKALRHHYGRSFQTIIAWYAASGMPRPGRVGPVYVPPARPCPPDFAKVLAAKGFNVTRKHFRTCTTTMKKWKAHLGIPTPRADALARTRKPKLAVEAKPAPRVMQPPAGYEQFKRRLGPVPTLYSVAA
jgi:hypothetical protein